MKRLTKKVDGVWLALCDYGKLQYPVVTQEVIDRLAAYEDTDLEPEQVVWLKEIMDEAFAEDTSKIERLRELAQADKEGRCEIALLSKGG